MFAWGDKCCVEAFAHRVCPPGSCLVRNNALTNALTFSYALSHALSKVNPRLVCCFTLSQMRSKTAAGVQNRCTKAAAVRVCAMQTQRT